MKKTIKPNEQKQTEIMQAIRGGYLQLSHITGYSYSYTCQVLHGYRNNAHIWAAAEALGNAFAELKLKHHRTTRNFPPISKN
ncbi:MAG: hypothetical protein IPI59_15470 [Sphingobacteriales bacterium]|jgi:hypothetical protein|nr:hypothetical protein [Sphingobacteriales bacterium]MBP9141700.1 hypothetical protein [Chitinophagales bacterium]MDA0198495.1 hypothetical protein [Bacteroidota bacterium]MBK6888596.1 hypothetical protein [Sphingobacteriales bacterium]MBK7528896.1 hypothetical protein [Sphingobacteriales bacterium]